MNNFFIVSILVTFGISIFFGLLFGLQRGTKKAIIRLVTLLVAFILAIAFTPLFAKMGGSYLFDFGKSSAGGLFKLEYMEFIENNTKAFSGILFMFLNPLLFTAVFFVFWILSYILFLILSVTIGRRSKDKDGNKKPKGRILGMIVGIACGFVMFFAIIVPFNGYAYFAVKAEKALPNDNKIFTEIEGKSIIGLKMNISEYVESPIAKTLGLFGLDRTCFDLLSTNKQNGHTTTLNKELDHTIDAIDSFKEIDKSDFLGNTQALNNFVDALFEIQLINIFADSLIDFAIQNEGFFDRVLSDINKGVSNSNEILSINEPNTLDDQETVINSIKDLFLDKDYLYLVLNELKEKGIKNEIKSCINVIEGINDLGISLTSIGIKSFDDLNKQSIETFVNLIFDIVIVRETLPILSVQLMNQLSVQMKLGKTYSHITMTQDDWNNEKSNIVTVFQNLKSISTISKFSDDSREMNDFFQNRANTNALGELMNSIRSSKLIGELYKTFTEFDTDKNEYFFISYLDEFLFNEGKVSEDIPNLTLSVRPIFESNALKVNPLNPKDNIDFDNFDWSELFASIGDIFVLVQNINQIELENLQNASLEEIMQLLNNLANLNPQMLQSLLQSIIPEGSNILIPSLDGIDLRAEAGIIEVIYNFNDLINQNREEGSELTQQEIGEFIETICESDFILTVLSSSGALIPISETEIAFVEQKLEQLSLPPEKINSIRDLLGI